MGAHVVEFPTAVVQLVTAVTLAVQAVTGHRKRGKRRGRNPRRR